MMQILVPNKMAKSFAKSRNSLSRYPLIGALFFFLASLNGCAVQIDDRQGTLDDSEELPAQLRAVVDVQRTTTFLTPAPFAGPGESDEESPEFEDASELEPLGLSSITEGDVLASMVEINEQTSPRAWQNLERAGLLKAIPEIDSCVIDQEASEAGPNVAAALSLADMEHFELLSAENEHDMAARAFPGVTPEMRGVVYTSRDRKGLGLSDVGAFELIAESSNGELIQGSFESPEAPEFVTVNDREFAEFDQLDGAMNIQFQWNAPGIEASDTVIVGVFDAEHSLYCRVNALSGVAELPLRLFPALQQGTEAWLSFRIIKDTEARQGSESERSQRLGYYARVEHAWLKSIFF